MYKVYYKEPYYAPRITYFRSKESLVDNFSVTLSRIAEQLNRDENIVRVRPAYYLNNYAKDRLKVEEIR